MAICGQKTGSTSDFLIFSKFVDMGIKRSQQTVCKNIQKHAI